MKFQISNVYEEVRQTIGSHAQLEGIWRTVHFTALIESGWSCHIRPSALPLLEMSLKLFSDAHNGRLKTVHLNHGQCQPSRKAEPFLSVILWVPRQYSPLHSFKLNYRRLQPAYSPSSLSFTDPAYNTPPSLSTNPCHNRLRLSFSRPCTPPTTSSSIKDVGLSYKPEQNPPLSRNPGPRVHP